MCLKKKSSNSIPAIVDDRHLKQLSKKVRVANKDGTRALAQVYANSNWKNLKCQSFKEWVSSELPEHSYCAARALVESGLITYDLTGTWKRVGDFSQNSMRCFRDLDYDQRQHVWSFLAREHKQEFGTKEITAKWLTAKRVKLAKSGYLGQKQEDVRPPSNGRLFDSLDPEDKEHSSQSKHNCTDSFCNDENDLSESKESQFQKEIFEDVVQIQKPPQLLANQKKRIKRFKALLEQFDGSQSVGEFLIEKVVDEYVDKLPSIDQVIARTAKKRCVKINRLQNKRLVGTSVNGGE